MSNSEMIIPERSRDIGDFLVGRILPFRKKRMIGPFIFIDHMGPEELGAGKYLDIGQHPHIGLSTLTYLFEGEIDHRDGLGTHQRISPGSVNWMTAGRGITHTERSPADLRDGRKFRMHGYQIWVALPRERELMEPEFFHVEASDLPRWTEDGATFTLIAGKGFGRVSPLPVYSDLFLVEVKSDKPTTLDISGQLKGELGVIVVAGSVSSATEKIENGMVLYSKVNDQCSLHLTAGSHIMLFGGEPLPEERHIYWNFVSSDASRIEAAKNQWEDRSFPMMEGEASYIPLPGHKKKD
jgi:redox-sensitive bicupin YhaK (pirin superfamily)